MSRYGFDEEKVFVDNVDGQLVALTVETGAYYTFNEAATAVVSDLDAGYELSEVEAALVALAPDADVPAKLAAFVADACAKDVLSERAGAAPAERPAMQCAALTLPASGFALEMDGYDDVAAYFMVDPIHEVDPSAGWPHVAE